MGALGRIEFGNERNEDRFLRLRVQTSSIDLYHDILSTHLPKPRGFPFFLGHRARVANLCMEVISVYRSQQDWAGVLVTWDDHYICIRPRPKHSYHGLSGLTTRREISMEMEGV